jgi:hypothetical protein
MPSLETWTVGTGGDYSTPPLAEDDLPSSLVADDKKIDIALFNEEWVSSSTFTLNGVTVDATRNVRVIAYARPDITELPVRYNTSAGPCIRETGDFKSAVRCYLPYTQFVGIQIKAAGEGLQLEDGTNNCIIDQCLIEAGWQSVRSLGAVTGTVARNTVLIRNSSGGSNAWYQSTGSWTLDNCTVVRASNYTPGGTALDNGFSTLTVRNTVVSGYSSFSTGTPGTSSNNAGTMATVPGSGSLNSLTATDLFEESSNASSALDLRLKAGSDLIDAGTDLSASGVTTDYAGTARGASYDIGAWEIEEAGATPVEGAGSASGSASASAVGATVATGAGSSTASGSAAAAGSTLSLGAGGAAGAGAATAAGLAVGVGAGAASGAATAAAAGATVLQGIGAASGAATASAAGLVVASGLGSATGIATAAAAGLTLGIAAGTASGAATVAAIGTDANLAPTPAPPERTIAWTYQSRTAAWREESRVVSWPFRSRTVTWRQ